MRIICLVPSWTETLLAAGGNVVGRTRYCIHPERDVLKIPVVGGTKKVDWQKIAELKPDIVVMDKEENTLEMSEQCAHPWIATHVQSMTDMPRALSQLSEKLQLPQLLTLKQRWQTVLTMPARPMDLKQPPALVRWVSPIPSSVVNEVVYVIWAHPWMAAGPHTFIASVMEWFGFKLWGLSKYPEFETELFQNKNPLFLCSSEPYPFAKRDDVMAELPGAVALVDGEKISWFGLRTLEYLESCF